MGAKVCGLVVLPCTRVPPTVQDGALGLLLISVVIRAGTSSPLSPLLEPSISSASEDFSALHPTSSFISSLTVEVIRRTPNPASRGWCVCTRCVAPDHSFFRRPLCVTFFSLFTQTSRSLIELLGGLRPSAFAGRERPPWTRCLAWGRLSRIKSDTWLC